VDCIILISKEAENLYQAMLKRFKQSKKIWVGYAFFLMSAGNMEQARNLLQRSLKSLPERKRKLILSYIHVKFSMFVSVKKKLIT